MRLHHLVVGALATLLPLLSRIDAGSGGIARLSAAEGAPRPGRLLRSSSDGDDGFGGAHHGRVRLSLLGASELIEADSIELSLPSPGGPDGKVYAYDLDWRDAAGRGWHGKLRDGEGTAHFAASPSKGLHEHRLAGMVHRDDGTTLRVTTGPDGTHSFESWDESSTAGVETSDPGEMDEGGRGEEARDVDDDGKSDRRLQEQPGFGDDDGSVIDHLSVYTRRAMCEHALMGFHNCPATPYVRAPIEEFIALQVTVTNYALANTGVPTRLNSVHVFMDPTYDMETDAVPPAGSDKAMIGMALGHLKHVGGGYLEEARRRQNQYCADIVTLFGTDGLGLASGQYSVVNHGSGGWGFAHEIGHNLNAGHRKDDPNKVGYGYGYGYGADDSKPEYYATIMAWGGKKVPMYSTPDHKWNGKIVGTATEDNGRSITDELVKRANKRRSEMCNLACAYGADWSPLGCPASCSKCHFPRDFCYDDPFFRYEGEADEDCEYVRKNTQKCDNTVSVQDGAEVLVKDHCAVSCDACPGPTPSPTDAPTLEGCADDPTFLKNSVDGRGCDWVAKSIATRCGDGAGDGYPDDEHIYDYCRLTCNMCHVDLTPPPTPTPCADETGNHFQDGKYGCDWIGDPEKVDVRCEKYSKARTHCPDTCGLCDVPTSAPTARGPCRDDDDWVYEAPKDKYSFLTCAWVRDDPGERCGHSRMKHHCPLTCDTCCEDEVGWYRGVNQSWGGDEEKDCAYYGENGCGNAAMDHCPRTCGLCPNYLANAGGPDPYSDYDEYGRVRHLRKGVAS